MLQRYYLIFNKGNFLRIFLEMLKFRDQFEVKLPAGQFVGNCILVSVNIGKPRIGTDILNIQQIKGIDAPALCSVFAAQG